MRVEILLAFGIAIVALTTGISIVMMLLKGKRHGSFLTGMGKASLDETDAASLD